MWRTTDRQTHTVTQTVVANIHFASSTTHAKCTNQKYVTSQRAITVEKGTLFIMWLWSLTHDLDLTTWPRLGHDEPPCRISRSKVIAFVSFPTKTHRQTDRHTDIGPIALPRPLKRWVKITGKCNWEWESHLTEVEGCTDYTGDDSCRCDTLRRSTFPRIVMVRHVHFNER